MNMESNTIPTQSFTWTNFYTEFADKLLHYKYKRAELVAILENVFHGLGMKYPFMENGMSETDICPFTVFGCFNKGITDENRKAIMDRLGKKLGVQVNIPEQFDGVPVLNNMKAKFYGDKDTKKPDDISNLWDVFEAGLQYADSPSEVTKNAIIGCYDKVRKQSGIRWNITMGLYWIRPFAYLNLDATNRSYLTSESNPFLADLLKVCSLKQLPSATTYLDLVALCKENFQRSSIPYHSFPELSTRAWIQSSPVEPSGKTSNASFLKWFVPVIDALRKLGGSATPEEVRNQIAADLNLHDEIINETRGKTGMKKFDNEVAFARNYLAYEGYIDKAVRGVWSLTEKGRTAAITEKIASDIFLKWVDILKERREI